MTAQTWTLSSAGGFTDLLHDANLRSVRAYVVSSEQVVTDTTTGGATRLGSKLINAAIDEPWSVAGLPATGDPNWMPAIAAYKLVVEYLDDAPDTGVQRWESNYFTLTADVDFKDVVAVTPTAVTPAMVANFNAAIAAITGKAAQMTLRAVTTNTTAADAEFIEVDATSAVRTVTGPAAGAATRWGVKKVNGTSTAPGNKVTISYLNSTGATTSLDLTLAGESKVFRPSGSGYRVESGDTPKAGLDAAYSLIFPKRRSGTTTATAALPWINPADYGAVFDGVTDDAAAWNAAAAAVPAGLGGTLIHPGGQSYMSATLVLKSGTVLIGPGAVTGSGFVFPGSFTQNMVQSTSWGTQGALDERIVIRDLCLTAPTFGGAAVGTYEVTAVGDYGVGSTIIGVDSVAGFPTSGAVWAGYQPAAYTGTNTVTTTVATSATAGASTLVLTSTAGLAPSGGVLVDGRVIRYTGISSNTLTGLAASVGSVPPGGLAAGATVVQAQLTGVTGLVAAVYTQATITRQGSQGNGIALRGSQCVLDNVFLSNVNGSCLVIDSGVENHIKHSRLSGCLRYAVEALSAATDSSVSDTFLGNSLLATTIIRGRNWTLHGCHSVGMNNPPSTQAFRLAKQAIIIAASQVRITNHYMDQIPASMFLIDGITNGWPVSYVTISDVTMLGTSVAGPGIGNFLTTRAGQNSPITQVLVNNTALSGSNFGVGFSALPATTLVGAQTLTGATKVQVTNTCDFPSRGRVSAGGSTVDYTGVSEARAYVVGATAIGATSMVLNTASGFNAAGGTVGYGSTAITYTGITGTTLTGIPASGTGSIAAVVPDAAGVTQSYLTGCQGGTTTEAANAAVYMSFPGGQQIAVANCAMLNFTSKRETFSAITGAFFSFAGCLINGVRMESAGSVSSSSTTTTIPHGLASTPQVFTADYNSDPGAITKKYVTADATNVYLVSSAALSSVTIRWSAKLLY